MKILVVTQYYMPDPFKTNVICEDLVKRGHDVTVLTGIPNYNFKDSGRSMKKGFSLENGVKIHRCFAFNNTKKLISRFASYFSFPINAAKELKKLKSEDFDAVFVYQLSPVMMAYPAARYKRKFNKNTKAVLYCLDLWPESLTVGGIRKNSPVYRIFHYISKRAYKAFDRIIISSRSFGRYFADEFGITNTKYVPQGIEQLYTAEDMSKEKDGYTDLLFAGNMGMAQSIDTILKAALKVKDRTDIRFHFVGNGTELEKSKQWCKNNGLDNVFFHGRHPLEKMPDFYRMADAALLTLQSDSFVSLTIPGKLQSYMAAGKPIIASINGEGASIVKEAECGYVCNAEDSDALARNIILFADNKELHSTMENNAKDYFDNHFRQGFFVSSILNEFEKRDEKVPVEV